MSVSERLKKIKIIHWLYNLYHFRELQHNRQAYRKYGIKKPLFASISSKDFPIKTSQAWLDLEDSAKVAPQKNGYNEFEPGIQEKIRSWSANGYMILPKFLDETTINAINHEIEQLVQTGRLHFTRTNKLMFANKISPFINEIAHSNSLIKIINFLLGKEMVPFQTINFIKGSGQKAHSDSIHMTTYPLGYLAAVWIALEDTNPENGPLFYYPGSHRLPYLLNDDFNEGETAITLGKKNYSDYENSLEEKLNENKLQKKVFIAKKGDIFIWHANLVHGGEPVIDPELTRKSMVVHYYANDVIKYHEITERPSLLKSK